MKRTLLPSTRARLVEILGTYGGHCSMCWLPRPGDLVFDSEEAIRAKDIAITEIEELLEGQCDRIAELRAEQEVLIEHLKSVDATSVRLRNWYDELVKERDKLRAENEQMKHRLEGLEK